MAFNFKNDGSQAARQNLVTFDLIGNNAEVTKPRQISDNCIVFTLKCSGFSFYNMKVCERKDGKLLVAVPSDKGNDGKYYNRYALYLSEADEEQIINNVMAILNGTEPNPFVKKLD